MRPLLKRFSLKPIQRFLLSKLSSAVRYAYTFDGVDDHGFFGTPIDLIGDFDVSVVVEGISASGSGQDFINTELRFKISIDAATGRPAFLIGNGSTWVVNFLDTTTSVYDGKRYELRGTRVGNVYTYYVNGVQKFQTTNSIPVTPQVSFVGRRHNGNISWAKGKLYDVKVNGVYWPLNQAGYNIQLPEPSFLGSELVSNPQLSGASSTTLPSWSRSNSAIFSYIGSLLKVSNGTTQDGTIQQSITTVAGQKYLIDVVTGPYETTVEMRLSVNNGSPAWAGSILATTIQSGRKFRIIFTATGSNTGIAFFTNSVIAGASISLASISIRNMGSVNPINLVNTTSERWSDLSYTPGFNFNNPKNTQYLPII